MMCISHYHLVIITFSLYTGILEIVQVSEDVEEGPEGQRKGQEERQREG